jgi:hypothetical protein
MRETRSSGSVRRAVSNHRSYRDKCVRYIAHVLLEPWMKFGNSALYRLRKRVPRSRRKIATLLASLPLRKHPNWSKNKVLSNPHATCLQFWPVNWPVYAVDSLCCFREATAELADDEGRDRRQVE